MRLPTFALLLSGLAFVLGGAQAMTAAAAAQAAPAQVTPPPPGPGLELINGRCGFCHSTAQVFGARKTPAAWAATVQSMADRGAEVSPEEQKVIADYLGAHYAAPADAPGATAVPPQPAAH